MQLPIFKHISQALNDYDLFLFDLWGVVVENEKLYPGVVESINSILAQKQGLLYQMYRALPSLCKKS